MKVLPFTHYWCCLLCFFLVISIACTRTDKLSNGDSLLAVNDTLTNLEGFDYHYLSVIQNVQHVLPTNRWLFSDIKGLADFGNNVHVALSNSQNDFSSLFTSTYQLLGAGAGGFGPPLSGTKEKINITNEADLTAFIRKLEINMVSDYAWDQLPFSLRKEVIEFIYQFMNVNGILRQYSEPVVHSMTKHNIATDWQDLLFSPWKNRELKDFASMRAIDVADTKKLSYATRLLSSQLNELVQLRELTIDEEFENCLIHTPAGKVLINGLGDNTIQGDYSLIVELGGDDTYLGNLAYASGPDQPMGIIVDFKGNDKYLSGEGKLVSATLGIAALIDMEGDDHYQTKQPGLAFSLYGSSILYDHSGDDIYESFHDYTQASSILGAAVLVDVSGNDYYNSKSYAQGFAGTLGASVFLDINGNDHYNTKNPEPQIMQSFVQGAARGRWAEASDGHSLGGGIGIFIDNSGADKYAAKSFSQGASYYFGLGVFMDKEGNDNYNARSHSQGYAAHYSLATFCDDRGNDIYNADSDSSSITQIIGGGRDHFIGLFVDHFGNDAYFFGNRSAGIGDLLGIGILIDEEGNDSYHWYKNEVNAGSQSGGQLIKIRQGMSTGLKYIKPSNIRSHGLFIDLTGDKIEVKEDQP